MGERSCLGFLRGPTALALAANGVVDDGIIADLVGTLTNWTEVGPRAFEWLLDHAEDAAEALEKCVFDADSYPGAVGRAAFILGRTGRVGVRKKLFARASADPAQRFAWYWFQRGARDDLVGVGAAGSEALAAMSGRTLFHSTERLAHVLFDGFVAPRGHHDFRVVYATDWLPWSGLVFPRSPAPEQTWGVLCWDLPDFVRWQKDLGHASRLHFHCWDDHASPEYLIPDPPMDLGAVRAVLVPVDAGDADMQWVRRRLPGVRVVPALAIGHRDPAEYAPNGACIVDTGRLFYQRQRAARDALGVDVLRHGATFPSRPPRTSKGRWTRRRRRAALDRWRRKLLDPEQTDLNETVLLSRIGRLRWPEAYALLNAILAGRHQLPERGQDSHELRKTCIRAIGLTGHHDAHRTLGKLAVDEDVSWYDAVTATLAMGELKTPAALQLLKDLRTRAIDAQPEPNSSHGEGLYWGPETATPDPPPVTPARRPVLAELFRRVAVGAWNEDEAAADLLSVLAGDSIESLVREKSADHTDRLAALIRRLCGGSDWIRAERLRLAALWPALSADQPAADCQYDDECLADVLGFDNPLIGRTARRRFLETVEAAISDGPTPNRARLARIVRRPPSSSDPEQLLQWLKKSDSDLDGEACNELLTDLVPAMHDPALFSTILPLVARASFASLTRASEIEAALLRAARGDDRLDRFRALDILASWQRTDTLQTVLAELCKRECPSARADAARAIGRAGITSDRQRLDRLARDPHPAPRIAARTTIATLGIDALAPGVVAGLDPGLDVNERRSAIGDCVRMNATRALPTLTDMVLSKDLAAAALDAALWLGDARILDLLLVAGRDAEVLHAVAAPGAPIRLSDAPWIVPRLLPRARHLARRATDPTIRANAIHALAQCGGPGDVPMLCRLLYADHDAVRVATMRALEALHRTALVGYLLDDANFLMSDTRFARLAILGRMAEDAEVDPAIRGRCRTILYRTVLDQETAYSERMAAARALGRKPVAAAPDRVTAVAV